MTGDIGDDTLAGQTAAADPPPTALAWSLEDTTDHDTGDGRWRHRAHWAGLAALVCALAVTLVWLVGVFDAQHQPPPPAPGRPVPGRVTTVMVQPLPPPAPPVTRTATVTATPPPPPPVTVHAAPSPQLDEDDTMIRNFTSRGWTVNDPAHFLLPWAHRAFARSTALAKHPSRCTDN